MHLRARNGKKGAKFQSKCGDVYNDVFSPDLKTVRFRLNNFMVVFLNEMVFEARDLLIPMKAFNPETFQVLKTHLEEQIRKLENRESVSDKVRRILVLKRFSWIQKRR